MREDIIIIIVESGVAHGTLCNKAMREAESDIVACGEGVHRAAERKRAEESPLFEGSEKSRGEYDEPLNYAMARLSRL